MSEQRHSRGLHPVYFYLGYQSTHRLSHPQIKKLRYLVCSGKISEIPVDKSAANLCLGDVDEILSSVLAVTNDRWTMLPDLPLA